MSRRQNRPRSTSDRVQDQFGFLMNQNYSNTGGRSGAKQRSDERVTTGNTGQNFLSNFIYGKEGQRKGKANVFGINIPDFGVTEAFSGAGQQVADVFKRKETADPNQTQLPNQAFNEDKFYRNLRGTIYPYQYGIISSYLTGALDINLYGNMELLLPTESNEKGLIFQGTLDSKYCMISTDLMREYIKETTVCCVG